MSGGQLCFFDPVLNRWLELQEANGIRHGRAILTGAFGHGFLRQLKFIHQSLKGSRCFYGVQVFALNILDERHLERQFVRHLPDDG